MRPSSSHAASISASPLSPAVGVDEGAADGVLAQPASAPPASSRATGRARRRRARVMPRSSQRAAEVRPGNRSRRGHGRRLRKPCDYAWPPAPGDRNRRGRASFVVGQETGRACAASGDPSSQTGVLGEPAQCRARALGCPRSDADAVDLVRRSTQRVRLRRRRCSAARRQILQDVLPERLRAQGCLHGDVPPAETGAMSSTWPRSSTRSSMPSSAARIRSSVFERLMAERRTAGQLELLVAIWERVREGPFGDMPLHHVKRLRPAGPRAGSRRRRRRSCRSREHP